MQQWCQRRHAIEPPHCMVDWQENLDVHLHRQQRCKRDSSETGRWQVAPFVLSSSMASELDCQWHDHFAIGEWTYANPADIGTTRLNAGRMRSLMSILGLYNHTTGSLEGCDDPGRVFTRRQTQNIRSLLCALSLLQLQGCDQADTADISWSVILTTMVIGLVLVFPLVISIPFSTTLE